MQHSSNSIFYLLKKRIKCSQRFYMKWVALTQFNNGKHNLSDHLCKKKKKKSKAKQQQQNKSKMPQNGWNGCSSNVRIYGNGCFWLVRYYWCRVLIMKNNEDRNKIMFSALPSELIMKIQALTKNYEDLKETVIKNYKEPNWVEKLINDARMIGWPSTTWEN